MRYVANFVQARAYNELRLFVKVNRQNRKTIGIISLGSKYVK